MSLTSGLRRRLARLLAVTAAMLFVTSLAAAPAHAALGPPQPVSMQLRAYTSTGVEYLVGRVVGTIQFDDANTAYNLSLTVCRQSSYVSPNVRVFVNGAYAGYFAGEDGTPRPSICPGHGMSGVINGTFTTGGTVQNVSITITGLFFNGSTATEKSKSAFYDNPFN